MESKQSNTQSNPEPPIPLDKVVEVIAWAWRYNPDLNRQGLNLAYGLSTPPGTKLN